MYIFKALKVPDDFGAMFVAMPYSSWSHGLVPGQFKGNNLLFLSLGIADRGV